MTACRILPSVAPQAEYPAATSYGTFWSCHCSASLLTSAPPQHIDIDGKGVHVVQAYILIQTEVGKAREVAGEISTIAGVVRVDAVTGPYDVVVLTEARNVDELGKMVVSKVQSVAGITRTVTCSVVHL
jgi:DNA-binding Lrp family transcriptional regulator